MSWVEELLFIYSESQGFGDLGTALPMSVVLCCVQAVSPANTPPIPRQYIDFLQSTGHVDCMNAAHRHLQLLNRVCPIAGTCPPA